MAVIGLSYATAARFIIRWTVPVWRRRHAPRCGFRDPSRVRV